MNYFPSRKCLHRYLKVAVCKKSRLSCGNLESTSITQELLVRSEVALTLPQNCSGFLQEARSATLIVLRQALLVRTIVQLWVQLWHEDVCFTIFAKTNKLQSGLSSRAKHGGPVFSAVSASIRDLTTVPGSCNHLGPPNLMTFAQALVF